MRDLMVVSHGHPALFTLQRPISLALLALIALVLFYSARQQKQQLQTKETISSIDPEGALTQPIAAVDETDRR